MSNNIYFQSFAGIGDVIVTVQLQLWLISRGFLVYIPFFSFYRELNTVLLFKKGYRNRKCFCKYIGEKRKQENAGPLPRKMENLVTWNIEKADLQNVFFGSLY